MMVEVELFDGTVLEFPEGTDPGVIDRVAKAETQQRRSAAQGSGSAPGAVTPAADAQPGFSGHLGRIGRGARTAIDAAGSLADGVRQGIGMVAALPVEAVNASPQLLNILPGEQGMTPFSDRPVGGYQDIDALLRAGGTIPDYEPETTTGRFANRIGEEIGATAVPLAGAGAVAARVGTEGARRMPPLARNFVDPMATAPGRVTGREMGYAVASGGGAQAANEIVDQQDHDGTWWSELLGSAAGMLGLGTAKAVGGLARNAAGAVTGRTGMFDDVAGKAVVDRIIDASSIAQEQAARFGARGLDVTDLARALGAPSAAEQAIPGFKANIADRVVDPGLSVLSYNTDAARTGASNLRRARNAAAVDERMAGLAPQGSPAALREALGAGAQGRIADAQGARDAARLSFGDAESAISPSTSAIERGGMLRSALAGRSEAELAAISDLYGQVDSSVPVDAGELADRFRAVTDSLPLNDRLRFTPSEAGAAAQLGEAGGTVPVSEAMALRSGLSSDMRAPSATSQQKHVTGQYLDETEAFLRSALPPEQAALLEQARGARLSYGKRFEDRGAVPDILRETGRGQYRMADESVPGRALAGETDYRAVMAEAGEDAGAKRAVRDQILSDAQRTNALRSPEALARFMSDRNFVIGDFPEIRADLERAGMSKQNLAEAERVAKETERAYSPGGSSAAGQYLRYDDTQTRAAIGTAWKSAQPEKAMRDLLDVAGDTPETRAAAKAALWEEVSGAGKLDAPTSTSADGVQRWSGRRLKQLFDDPRFAKTAEVLWEDNPQHLTDMRQVADALATADGSVNAKAPGTSGTGQALTSGYDPSMTTASIASRARSVNRGQLSPTIAIVDVLSTYLRNRSAKVQSRAIDELLAKAVNDPDLAAALVKKFNPADEAAENRAFLSAFGARLPTVANAMIDEDEDSVMRWAAPE